MTNVLLTTGITGLGGVQVVFRDLTHWLEARGRRAHLLYQSPLSVLGLQQHANPWGREATYCPMPGIIRDSATLSVIVLLAYLPLTLFHLVRLMRRKRIDAVNCHYLTPYFIHLVIAARLLRVPLILSVHGADIDSYATADPLTRWLLRRIVGGAHAILACSDALARQMVAAFPATDGKVTYVHNGVDLSHYAATPAPRALPPRFLLCVCRHVHKKGVDTLLHAFALVWREMSDMSLVMVGSGPLLEEHKALARTLGIEQQVFFAGDVAHADVASYFAASTIFVLPSRAEPFGVVLLEAAYYRKPIVCTRVGGVPEIITHGVNGRLVEPDDPAGMAAEVLALLRNPALAARLTERAHDTLMTRFLWRDRIDDYIDVFEGRARPLAGASAPGPSVPPAASMSSGAAIPAD